MTDLMKFDSPAQTIQEIPDSGIFGQGLQEARVQILNEADLDPMAIASWKDLETNAVPSSLYLSRSFLEPAIRAQLGQGDPIYIVIEREGQWLGVGVFESVSGTRNIPLPHLRSWRTSHSYLDGMLIRQGDEQVALQAFWKFMQEEIHPWYAVEFGQLAEDDPVSQFLEQTAAQVGVELKKGPSVLRAMMDVPSSTDSSEEGATADLSAISSRRAKSLRQSWNWLTRQGEVSFDIQRDPENLKQSAERFLELESLGWKSEAGTSLASNQKERQFFLELVERFSRDHKVFFLELSVDDVVIGSVVHFVSGDISYAFKLGWDPEYARGCPGYQLKAQTLYHASQMFPELRMIDSCSCPDSFIEHVWAGRREISSKVFLTSQVASVACSLVGGLKWVRDRSWQLLCIGSDEHDATDR